MARGGKPKTDDRGVPDDTSDGDDGVEPDELPDVPNEKPVEVEYASADALLSAGQDDRPTEDVYLPAAGMWLRIQSLTRDEAIKVSDTKGSADRERKIITWALVAPQMTYQDVERWHRKAVAGDVQELVMAVTRLSGIDEDSRKQASKRFPEDASA